MAKREFVMLAHNYNSAKHGIGGYLWSEKLDGMFCYWDGGVSTGILKSEVPWANCDKDSRYLDPPVATGLWSRYGNVIHAPKWWTNEMPKIPLCGELFNRRGRGGRQELMSTVKDLIPHEESWAKVKLHCYNMPAYESIFADGRINNTNFKKNIKWSECEAFIKRSHKTLINGTNGYLTYDPKPTLTFQQVYYLMRKHNVHESSVCEIVRQTELPMHTTLAEKVLDDVLVSVLGREGEGIVIINPNTSWIPERTHNLLKIKDINDMEGIVTGYTSGRETELGSKLLGKMGALILEIPGGARLELSGFTDEERLLRAKDGDMVTANCWAVDNPGKELPDHYEAIKFPRGTTVTFKYRDLTNDGIPQEARYFRKRVSE